MSGASSGAILPAATWCPPSAGGRRTAAAPTTGEGPEQDAEPAAAAAAEPSHEAVGIGVMGSADGQDHHGQDEGRDTLTVGEAQRQGGTGEQKLLHHNLPFPCGIADRAQRGCARPIVNG